MSVLSVLEKKPVVFVLKLTGLQPKDASKRMARYMPPGGVQWDSSP